MSAVLGAKNRKRKSAMRETRSENYFRYAAASLIPGYGRNRWMGCDKDSLKQSKISPTRFRYYAITRPILPVGFAASLENGHLAITENVMAIWPLHCHHIMRGESSLYFN